MLKEDAMCNNSSFKLQLPITEKRHHKIDPFLVYGIFHTTAEINVKSTSHFMAEKHDFHIYLNTIKNFSDGKKCCDEK